MTKKKKIFVLSIMCLLLIVTGYLNFALADDSTSTVSSNIETSATYTFFETYRIDREDTRSLEMEYLDAIISSTESVTAQKENATAQKMELVQKMEKELVLEGLIKAKGFDDVIVTISAENYNIMVKCEDNLSSDQVAQILNVITTQTGASATNVKIIPIN